MNKLLLFLITLSTFLYSQCETLTEYPCALNPECKWVSENIQGSCNDLSIEECRSGEYNYCYWNTSYNGQSECLGATYSKSSGYCESSDNVLNQYLSNTVDQALILLLTSAGLLYSQEGDIKIFIDQYDDFSIHYKTIELSLNGFKIINPGIYIYESNNSISHFQFDSISFNMSLDQFIYLLGDMINNENIGKIEGLTLKGIAGHLTQTNDSKYMDWSLLEATVGEIEFDFNGYINQKIIDDIDRQIRMPDIDQEISLNFSDFEILKVIANDGSDLLLDPLKMLDIEQYRNKLYKINSVSAKAQYLPTSNKVSFEGKLNHPFLTFNSSSTTDIEFNYTDPDNSKFLSTTQDFSLEFNLPNNKNLDLEKLDLDHLESMVLRIPDSIFLSFSLQYDNLQDLINQLNYNDANIYLNKNAFATFSFNIDNFAFKIADVESLQNRSYTSQTYRTFNTLDVDSFRGNITLRNNKFKIDTDLYSNMCNVEGDVEVDIYDLTNPWIDKALFSIANITTELETYISSIETQMGQTFPRQYNSIILDIIGYLNNPEIKNMQTIIQQCPANCQKPCCAKTTTTKLTNPNLQKEFMDACIYTNRNTPYCECAYPLYEKYGPSRDYVIEVDKQCLYLKY